MTETIRKYRFKTADHVKIVNDPESSYIGRHGLVKEVAPVWHQPYLVCFPTFYGDCRWFDEDELESFPLH